MFNRKTLFVLLAVIMVVGFGYLFSSTTAQQGKKRAFGKPEITPVEREDTPVVGVSIVSTEATEAGGLSITLQNVSAKPVSFVHLLFWERNGVTSDLPIPFYSRAGGALMPGETYTNTSGSPDMPKLDAVVYSDGTAEGFGRGLKKSVFFHNTYLNAQKRFAETIESGQARGDSADVIAQALRAQAAMEAGAQETRSTGALEFSREILFALSERGGTEPVTKKIDTLRRNFNSVQAKTLRTQEECTEQ